MSRIAAVVVACALTAIAGFPVRVAAQRTARLGLRVNTSADARSQGSHRAPLATIAPDSTPAKHGVGPFIIAGAVLGAIVGGVLAASYNPCGEPQPGVVCTSTDTATGVAIGAGVGIGVGLLAWLAMRPRTAD